MWYAIKSTTKEFTRHVSAIKIKEITEKLDPLIWKKYFKFCVVRNPWDLCVSRFFWRKNGKLKEEKKDKSFEHMIEKLNNKNKYLNHRKNIYQINGEYICDFHIKYENLLSDLKVAFEIMGIKKYDIEKFPHINGNTRNREIHYSRYYNSKTKDIVAKIYKDDIKKFKYEFEKF